MGPQRLEPPRAVIAFLYPRMNLPNSLTLLRIFFVPVLIVILLTRSPNIELWGFPMHFEFWGVLILLLAAATDWADGYVARRRLQVTTLGILLDPIADKLLISAAFVSLVDMQLVPAWMVVIIIGLKRRVPGSGDQYGDGAHLKDQDGFASVRRRRIDRRSPAPFA